MLKTSVVSSLFSFCYSAGPGGWSSSADPAVGHCWPGKLCQRNNQLRSCGTGPICRFLWKAVFNWKGRRFASTVSAIRWHGRHRLVNVLVNVWKCHCSIMLLELSCSVQWRYFFFSPSPFSTGGFWLFALTLLPRHWRLPCLLQCGKSKLLPKHYREMDPWDTNSQPPGSSAPSGDTGRLAGWCQCPHQPGSLPCEARAPASGRRSSRQNPGWSLPGVLSTDPEEPQRSVWHGHCQRCWAQSTSGKEDDSQRHQNSLQVPLEEVLLLCLKLCLGRGDKRNTWCQYYSTPSWSDCSCGPSEEGMISCWAWKPGSCWVTASNAWETWTVVLGFGTVQAALSTWWTRLSCPRLI